MIAEIAFRRGHDRGIQGGDPLTDWVEAEHELSETFTSSMGG